MTATRLFFVVLVLTTVFLAWLDRPVFPTPAPSLNTTLPQVSTVPQRQSVHGYDRSDFGDWAPALVDGHFCTTRTLVLAHTFSSPTDSSCSVPRSDVRDPYTGDRLDGDVQVDHIFPLRAAWDLGAHSWTAAERARFANDPLNLVAVSASANQEKSDSLPSEWQPQLKTRCWYARRLAHVAAYYALALPDVDVATMKRACYGEHLFRPLVLER